MGTDAANVTPDIDVRWRGVKRLGKQAAGAGLSVALSFGAAGLLEGAVDQQLDQQDSTSAKANADIQRQDHAQEVANFLATHPGASEQEMNAHFESLDSSED